MIAQKDSRYSYRRYGPNIAFPAHRVGTCSCYPVYASETESARRRCEKGLKEHFQAGGSYTERMDLKSLRSLVSCPTLVLAMTQGLFGCIPGGVSAQSTRMTILKRRTFVLYLGVSRASNGMSTICAGNYIDLQPPNRFYAPLLT